MTETGLLYGGAWASLLGLALLGVLSGMGWLLQPRHRYWMWLALGHAAMGAWWWAWLSWGSVLSLWWVGAWYVASAGWPQAMLARLGLKLHIGGFLALAALLMLLTQAWRSTQPEAPPLLQGLWLLGAWALAWLPACLQAWQTPHRHRAETWSWVAACVCVPLALLAGAVGWITVHWEWWLPAAQRSPWPVLVAGNALLGAALSAALLGCWASDGQWRWRRGGAQATQGPLSRTAFEAACGDAPHARGIRVMLLCDIDDFAQLAQQHGTAAGQQIVQRFGQILRETLREGDWLGQLGEDEFAVALRHVPVQGTGQLIARIRQQMAHTTWLPGQTLAVTASFGVVQVHAHDRLDWLLHRADVWLYLAKDAGRSQVRGDGMPSMTEMAPAASH